jgi:hypothetical protein
MIARKLEGIAVALVSTGRGDILAPQTTAAISIA